MNALIAMCVSQNVQTMQLVWVKKFTKSTPTNVCTECVGHYDKPQCQIVCPIACIPTDPAYMESAAQLMQKYHDLQNKKLLTGSK
ncbi:MAG: hypothetical protein RIR83_1647 [Pseudomonadota bacterium]